MSITRCRHLAVLMVCGGLAALLPLHGSSVEPAGPPQTATHVQPPFYPEIVRIRYAEGDVRVARGKRGATWENAVTGLPLETGFNLVTGAGRAEIEFEDASTVYLGENSALTFNDLHTTGGVPHTDVALLAGTATLDVHATIAGELFFLDTPMRRIVVTYPNSYFERVNSYLDGMTVTPLKSSGSDAPEGAERQASKKETTIYSPLAQATEPSDPAAFAEWDNWVAKRVAERDAAMSAVMKASGLSSPLPGLADMNGQGTFFPCEPYGTCWAPAKVPGQPAEAQISAQIYGAGSQPSQPNARPVGSGPITPTPRDPFFPCHPGGSRFLPNGMPYDWGVCHAGSWIYYQHNYAWVAGSRRHHHCPVHWVKNGRSVAYVPIHPKDAPGKLPLNRVHGIFTINGRQGHSVEWAHLDPGHEVKLLDTPPRGFRDADLPVLSRAANPQVQAHHLAEAIAARNNSGVKETATRLTFDHRSQSFMVDKHDTQGVRGNSERAVLNERMGSLQGRAGSVDAHGNYSTHVSGGGGRSSGGGNYGGGNSHAGGSSGGGGSHSSGGGFSGGSSGASGSSVSGSSSAVSSGAGGGSHR